MSNNNTNARSIDETTNRNTHSKNHPNDLKASYHVTIQHSLGCWTEERIVTSWDQGNSKPGPLGPNRSFSGAAGFLILARPDVHNPQVSRISHLTSLSGPDQEMSSWDRRNGPDPRAVHMYGEGISRRNWKALTLRSAVLKVQLLSGPEQGVK